MRNNFSLAQCLYNEGGSAKDNVQDLLAAAEQDESLLAKHFTNDELDNCPIRTAVQLAAGDAYEAELELYINYMEIFIDAMREILGLETVIDVTQATDDEVKPFYGVSQNISGDINITVGVIATEAIYLKLAACYSDEEFAEVDELAVDSLEELLNVINGLFCIELANDKIEAELGIPRTMRNITPKGTHQLQIKAYNKLGAFKVILAADEFL